jgi:hypothetical protein
MTGIRTRAGRLSCYPLMPLKGLKTRAIIFASWHNYCWNESCDCIAKSRFHGKGWFNPIRPCRDDHSSRVESKMMHTQTGQTQSSGRRRDQLGAGVRQANAKIQFGGDFSRVDRPSDIDRPFIRHLVGFSKAAECPLEVTHAKAKKEWKSALRPSCWRGLSSTSQ